MLGATLLPPFWPAERELKMQRALQKQNKNNDPITLFAITDYRNDHRIFGIKKKDRGGYVSIPQWFD